MRLESLDNHPADGDSLASVLGDVRIAWAHAEEGVLRLVILRIWLGEGQRLGCWHSRTSRLIFFCSRWAEEKASPYQLSALCSVLVQGATGQTSLAGSHERQNAGYLRAGRPRDHLGRGSLRPGDSTTLGHQVKF